MNMLYTESSAVSADGRVIAFHARGRGLVVGDTNLADDVFVLDRTPEPAVGGMASGLNTRKAVCLNKTTGQRIDLALAGEPSWDCNAAGLIINPGDFILMRASGRGSPSGVGLGGRPTGIVPRQAECINARTGQRVVIEPLLAGAWNCEAAGLVVEKGDRVLTSVKGPALEASSEP
jgi:hypothetical protein